MTQNCNTDDTPVAARRLTGVALMPWLALGALLAVAIALRPLLAANTDIGWLLTVGERVLAGDRLYADVIETNPPMAVLAYLPGILLGRALGVSAERAVDALVLAGIALSLALATRNLHHAASPARQARWPMVLLTFAVLAILPTQSFGQREHLALVAMLPWLALLAARMTGAPPFRVDAIAAGLGAAVALSFKPYFLIPVLAALAAAALVTRCGWRILRTPETVTLVVGTLLYAVLVALWFPEFVSVIGPMVRDVYLQVKLSPAELLAKPALSLWATALLVALALKRRGAGDAVFILLLTTSAGFAAVFVLQARGWPYHSYPMIALALLTLGHVLLSAQPATSRARLIGFGAVVLLIALFARAMLWFDAAFDARPLQDRVAQLDPHPVVLAISGEPGIGHPLVRALRGTWVSRQQGLWVAAYVQAMRAAGGVDAARDRVLEAYAAQERAWLIEDIRARPPTVVLVDDLTGAGTQWLNAHPDMAMLLADFHAVDSIHGVGILMRR